MAGVRIYAANGILKYGPGDHGELTGLGDDDHTQYPLISTGTTPPSSTPSRVGLVYVDTTADIVYVSKGTASSADWYPVSNPAMTASVMAGLSSPVEGTLVYANDTDMQHVYDGQRFRDVAGIGWQPFAYPVGLSAAIASVTSIVLAADGGSVATPILLPGHMLLQSATVRSNNTTLQRTWGWDLYVQYLNNGNSGENTLTRVAASNGNDTYTASVATNRTLAASSAPVYLGPGLYWLVIQCRHASNNWSVQADAGSHVTAENGYQTKTTTNPNGATLDFVAATWTKGAAYPFARLNGRVFGETTAF